LARHPQGQIANCVRRANRSADGGTAKRRLAPAVSAKRIYADLQNAGARCWLAEHDLPIGAKILDEIY
jgi:hypothetical protein